MKLHSISLILIISQLFFSCASKNIEESGAYISEIIPVEILSEKYQDIKHIFFEIDGISYTITIIVYDGENRTYNITGNVLDKKTSNKNGHSSFSLSATYYDDHMDVTDLLGESGYKIKYNRKERIMEYIIIDDEPSAVEIKEGDNKYAPTF